MHTHQCRCSRKSTDSRNRKISWWGWGLMLYTLATICACIPSTENSDVTSLFPAWLDWLGDVHHAPRLASQICAQA